MRRRFVGLVLVLLAVLAVAGAAFAGDPRSEQVRLRAADVALAKRVTASQRDVGRAWTKIALPPSKGERMTCPGFDPDFSAFTITGKAASAYAQRTGASVVSTVEVYESRADAVGDFRVGARPQVAQCLRRVLQQELASSPLATKVVSARVVGAPRVGERRIAYRLVATLEGLGQKVTIYLDVVAMQRGRSVVALMFTSPQRPSAQRAAVSAAVAARMR
jgi:hypothetical protein